MLADDAVGIVPVARSTQVVPARLPAPVEATAHPLVAEALTGVLVRTGATTVARSLPVHHGALDIGVDDGGGGAGSDGSGPVSVVDRVDVLGRTPTVDGGSAGTQPRAALPCE